MILNELLSDAVEHFHTIDQHDSVDKALKMMTVARFQWFLYRRQDPKLTPGKIHATQPAARRPPL